MAYRSHYPKRQIAEIDPELDFKVKVIGFIVDKKEDVMVIDDGTGKVRVFVDVPLLLERFNLNQIVAVFGSTLPTENGFDIRADVVQDMTGLNLNLYKKVDELYNKVGV